MEGEFGELEVDPFPGENLSTGRRIPGDLINGMEDFAEAIPRVRRNDEEVLLCHPEMVWWAMILQDITFQCFLDKKL